MKRFLYLLGYVVFALVVPVLMFNSYFPIVTFLDKSTTYQVTVGGVVALLVILAFFRKNISKWVHGFDKVTGFRGIFMWIVYIFPSGFAFLIMILAYENGKAFMEILGATFVSHMIAGVFSILAEKQKVEDFKKWVKK